MPSKLLMSSKNCLKNNVYVNGSLFWNDKSEEFVQFDNTWKKVSRIKKVLGVRID